jgi:peptidoglycan/LPS O-acetylase OafA/YrhL
VTWTLHYEWLFYANLLWLAVFARWRWTHLPFASVGLALCLVGGAAGGVGRWVPAYELIFAALFFSGMTCASLERSVGRLTLPPGVASVAVCALLLVLFGNFDNPYAPMPALLVGACFLLIASGGSLFGLLTSRGAQRLGSASFSIYLLQGPALAVVYASPAVQRFALRGGLHPWATVALACTLLVGAAMLSFRYAERPGIAAGRLLRRRPRVAAPSERPGSVSQPG